MTTLSAIPPTHFPCQWCSGAVRWRRTETGEQVGPDRCPHCALSQPVPLSPAAAPPAPTSAAPREARARRGAPRTAPFTDVGPVVFGIDPGARYVGLCLRRGDHVLYAETLVRPQPMADPMLWARHVADYTRHVYATVCPPGTLVGIEGVSAPKGFKDGQRASLDPKHIVFTAAVAGGVAIAFPDAAIIAPGGNGSQHLSHYPPSLTGRRPKDLPGSNHGAGTRAHEQSAFDVAGKAASVHAEANAQPA